MADVKKGIDISQWNWNKPIDFQKVKDSGIEFIMIRAGYGRKLDPMFHKTASECDRLGIPFGTYWFAYSLNAAGALEEAKVCIDALKDHKPTYPICYDLEYDSVNYAKRNGVVIDRPLATAMARNFLTAIKNAGYIACNYTNIDYIRRYFDADVCKEFPMWIAQWPNKVPTVFNPPVDNCVIWQYSEKGKVPGIVTDVDMDVSFVDYAKLKEEDEMMTGEQIYNALNEYTASLPLPSWATENPDLNLAKEIGLTDGKNPMSIMPRYQGAIMAARAYKAGYEKAIADIKSHTDDGK